MANTGIATDLNAPEERRRATAAGIGSVIHGIINPSGLQRAKAAFAGALHEPMIAHFVGDSLVYGVGIDGTSNTPSNEDGDLFSSAGQFRTLCAKHFGTGEGGLITPRFQGTDGRVASSGSPGNISTTGPMMTGKGVTNVQSITYTTPPCTTLDILHYQNNVTPITGPWSYSIDGGGAVTVAQATPYGQYKAVRVTGLSDAAHSVVITATTATNAYNFGVRHHYNKGVVVSRYGQPGWNINDFTGVSLASPAGSHNNAALGAPTSQTRLLASFQGFYLPGSTVANNLTVIEIGHNDCSSQLVELNTPEQFGVAVEAVVDQVITGGGSALLVSSFLPPTEVSPGPYTFEDYQAVMGEIAVGKDHCSYMNMNWITGGAANAVSLGFNISNSVHLYKRGYGAKAQAIFNALRDPFPLY